MAHLIVGNTTHNSARIWVRGDRWRTSCEVTVSGEDGTFSRSLQVGDATDYTGATEFNGLKPDSVYVVTATFSPIPRETTHGRFRTFPAGDGEPAAFSFVLSSCNLSVVSINNFLALLLATTGTSLAMSSLRYPLEKWKVPGSVLLRWILRWFLRWSLKLVAFLVMVATEIKQPDRPYLRSPFLKLAAIFESQLLDVLLASGAVLAAGDRLVAGAASGTLACTPVAFDNGSGLVRLVLTQVDGEFKADRALNRQVRDDDRVWLEEVGSIKASAPGKKWYDAPTFFLHAGDQIYYDFPKPGRPPKRDEYRLTYREAFFDDEANRYLLSHWPQYMTLDDHEIADQFARDFNPPEKAESSKTYLNEAMGAYREYVGPLMSDGSGAGEPPLRLWYTFDKGASSFFVMDTRTQRCQAQMIDDAQLNALLAWLEAPGPRLKFVVTSVPFVAEIDDERIGKTEGWTKSGSKNHPNDKWCADRFKGQRHRIIRFIAEKEIEHVVFLTGDMHCCYHATMRIGAGSQYESTTIHELASGPVNQLQLAEMADFHRRLTLKIPIPDPRPDAPRELICEVLLNRFHGEVNGVMHINVQYPRRESIDGQERSIVPEIEWNVVRTLTDNALAWTTDEDPGRRALKREEDSAVRSGEPVMTGRISFVEKRKLETLADWQPAVAGRSARWQ